MYLTSEVQWKPFCFWCETRSQKKGRLVMTEVPYQSFFKRGIFEKHENGDVPFEVKWSGSVCGWHWQCASWSFTKEKVAVIVVPSLHNFWIIRRHFMEWKAQEHATMTSLQILCMILDWFPSMVEPDVCLSDCWTKYKYCEVWVDWIFVAKLSIQLILVFKKRLEKCWSKFRGIFRVAK